MTNAFILTNGLAANKKIELKFSTVRNPPTLKPYTTFDIYTTDSNGALIETCSGLTLTITQIGSLSVDSTFVKLTDNFGVSQMGIY